MAKDKANEITGTQAPPELPKQRKSERFTCNTVPGLSFAVGPNIHYFKEGVFETDDPKLIKAVCNLQFFGTKIIPDNRELLPEWMRKLPKQNSDQGDNQGK